MSMLYQVVYCSRNLAGRGPRPMQAELDAILAASRRNNADCGVTGGLLFSDDLFAQVLEGPMDEVMTTFERIQSDERHGEVVVLQAGPIATRSFEDWSMGFAVPDADARGQAKAAAQAGNGGALFALLRSVVTSNAGQAMRAGSRSAA